MELPCFVEGEDSSQGGTGRNKQIQILPDSRSYPAPARPGRKHWKGLISGFASFIQRSRPTKLEGIISVISAGAIPSFPAFLPGFRTLPEKYGCPDHDGFSVSFPGAIRLLSRCDRLSPAMLLCIRCPGGGKPRRFSLRSTSRASANPRNVLPAAFARPPSRCNPCFFRPPLLHCFCADGLASKACSCIVRLCVRKRQGRVRKLRAWNVQT